MNIFANSIPDAAPADIIAWADSCGIKVDGHSFDSARTPQLIEPMRAMIDPEVRVGTFIKPVQSGGSTAGEVVLAYWASFYHGLCQYNWQDDQKAVDRWERRISPMLNGLQSLRWAGDRFDETVGCARFINSTVYVQGVIAKGSLDSETIPFQINEEIHLWSPGLLDKARRRQTLVWNSKAFDISNASNEGDQLHAAYEEGTMEVWETLCPGCGAYHEMRFRFDEKHPELGGLRFDTAAGRGADGKYNFNKLVPTIHYQFPITNLKFPDHDFCHCGFIMRDSAKDRRIAGQYRKTNEGALSYKRSWTYEGVSVPEIKWPELVSEWLKACRARKSGDLEPMRRFVTERECRFWSKDLIPFHGEMIVVQGQVKNREGWKDRAARLWMADWQQGYKHKGEMEHFWLVIQDVDDDCNSIVIYEGKINSETELVATLEEFDCIEHGFGFVDVTGPSNKHLLQFCYQHDLHAIMLEGGESFLWADKIRRYHDEGRPISNELRVSTKYPLRSTGEVDVKEPLIYKVKKGPMIANHFFMRNHKSLVLAAAKEQGREPIKDEWIDYIIPEDVSDDFRRQWSSWEQVVKPSRHGEQVVKASGGIFEQVLGSDHMLICNAGIDACKEILGLLGERLEKLGISKEPHETK